MGIKVVEENVSSMPESRDALHVSSSSFLSPSSSSSSLSSPLNPRETRLPDEFKVAKAAPKPNQSKMLREEEAMVEGGKGEGEEVEGEEVGDKEGEGMKLKEG